MTVLENYEGRKFLESDFYKVISRNIAGLSSNRIWLYSVDKCFEKDRDTGKITDKVVLRIVRWAARNDKKNKDIKYWKARSSYNVRSSDEWSATSELVSVMIDNKMEDPKFILIPNEEYLKITGDKSDYTDLIQIVKKLKSEKSARTAQLDVFKKRFKLMKANITEYEKIISEFKSLIDKTDSTETEVHNFVVEKNAFWLFGLEYVDIESKVNFPPGKRDYEFDIMLKRNDNFWDLAELKGPNENLFDKRTKKRNKPNTKLSEALGQVFTYLHVCDTKKLKNIFKPKAIIVIGKKSTDKIEERRLFSSYLSNVDLMTYSDLYMKGKKLLEYIKSSTMR